MLQVISATKARQQFLPLLDEVSDRGQRYMVTRHGRPAAIILSYEDYSRMEASLRLMENREAAGDLTQGLEDIRWNRLTPFE